MPSFSQARRRILAPAHRAAAGPTTTAPFPSSTRPQPLTMLDHPRRTSMPGADGLQLYHPLTLQSLPSTPNHHHPGSDYVGSNRHLGLPPSNRSSHMGLGALDFGSSRHMGIYSPGHAPHSAGPTSSSNHYISSDVPLSAPPLGTNPFPSHPPHQSHSNANLYPTFNPSPRLMGQTNAQQEQQSQQYFNDGHPHSGSTPGSGYGTPQ